MSPPTFDEELRVRQAMHLVKMMPFLLFGNVAVAAGIAYQSGAALWATGAWLPLALEILILFPIVQSWVRLRTAPRPERVSDRHILKVKIHSACMGGLWAVAAGLLFPQVNAFDQYVLMTGIGVLALGGAATIYAIPTAALLYTAPIWVTLFVCTLLFDATANNITIISTLITGVSAACILQANWVTFTGNVRTSAERAQFLHDSQSARGEVEQALQNLRAMQRTVVQSEKLASLGQLVAGVAHEINTPVGVAVTGASMVADEVGRMDRLMREGKLKRSEFASVMQAIQQASDVTLSNLRRAADLIHSFKTVAVEQTAEERRRFDLGAYTHDVMASLGPALSRRGVAVEIHCADIIIVDGYPGAVSQILTNLAMNALAHAFDPGQTGRLLVEAGRRDDGRIRMIFADDGRGIPQDDLPQIFEPFFTTKRGSGGSGLGLHIVFNLVTGVLGGTVDVESVPGEGTRFLLIFPDRAPAMRPGPRPVPRAAE